MSDVPTFPPEPPLAEAPGLQAILFDHPLFAGMDDTVFQPILHDAEWFSLAGGWTLFREGDRGDALYLVTSGSLVATICSDDHRETTVARIHAGETVGEMALLSGEPRSATVRALRDSSLLRIGKETFDRLVYQHPAAMLHLTQLLARRLAQATRSTTAVSPAKTIALLPLGPRAPCRELAHGLMDELTGSKKRCRILDVQEADRTAEWFHSIESAYDLCLYLAEFETSPWTQLCLRQADRILLVLDRRPTSPRAPEPPGLTVLPQRPCDLVVVHAADAKLAEGADPMVAAHSVDLCAHIRLGNRNDLSRTARLVTDRAVGLVLSAGGARGFAHLGAIRALRSAGVPFDMLGGTSMGAVIAAGLALEWDDAELAERMVDAFVTTNPLRDYTLPLIALTRGKEVTRQLRRHFGGCHLEGLWRPYFCVSSDLTSADTVVHRTGPLWRALRASVAIPGLLPPVVEDGRILVDGGVMDGFPIGTMRAMGRGPVVGVNVSTDPALATAPPQLEQGSPWWLLWQGDRSVPGIVSLLVRATTVSSDAQAKASRSLTDLLLEPPVAEIDLLNWRSFQRAIELGYDYTMRTLEDLEAPLFQD